MEFNWIDKKNVWPILAGFLFYMAVGKFIDHLPAREKTSLKFSGQRISPKIEKETKKAKLLLTEQRTIKVKITAHCPDKCCCGKYAGQNTLFGENPWETSGIAARRNFLPTGTILEIPGVGTRIVDSFGGRNLSEKEKKQGIQGVISLRMENHEEAKEFGVKVLEVKIIGNIKLDNASEVAPSATVLMEVSGYCSCKECCGPNACGLTATGKNSWITSGVAADLNLLPAGTELKIPGVGERVVDDNGGDMRQNAKKGICHIDVRFYIPDGVEICLEEIKKCHQEAVNFGRQYLKVKILEMKEN